MRNDETNKINTIKCGAAEPKMLQHDSRMTTILKNIDTHNK